MIVTAFCHVIFCKITGFLIYAPIFSCLCYKIIRIKDSPEVELNADEIVRVHMRARPVMCLYIYIYGRTKHNPNF